MKEIMPNTPESGSTGAFDAHRAADLRAQALDTFKSQMIKIERLLNGWLIFMLLITFLAALMFFRSTDTQSWIMYGVLFLIGFNSTILLKLWYWILNNKIGVLREIKLLRLDLAAHHGALDTLERIVQVEPQTRPPGLSKKERWIWRSLILAVGIAIGVSPQLRNLSLLFHGSRMTSQRTVSLKTDGTGRMETIYSLQNPRRKPIREITIYSGGTVSRIQHVPAKESAYRDRAGRQLAYRVEPAGQNKRHVIRFIDPVLAYEHFTLTSATEVKASRDGETWTFSISQNWGYQKNHYTDTLILPPEAQVVSTKPVPESHTKETDRLHLKFTATLGENERWQYEIKYHLANK